MKKAKVKSHAKNDATMVGSYKKLKVFSSLSVAFPIFLAWPKSVR
ncbi:hypothetical protein [Lactobacillus pasteurii]|uniref:Uncharacterized protein n=1 Tax=Lactobacillus pasteurii DSM 23907 = CRBIP 24.76 TaxID=1423790 RepID=I7JXN3_9LACO|nr:hypothetical protein [Lactobacillus pasteurii]TDG77056.1 hypothetical protein C5L33_000699 [Lactobacillus pasteurii]CCI84800.1 Protein of unknown function [Lactobacillus pasteurii DSM 23907 = CRBIP 24.76]